MTNHNPKTAPHAPANHEEKQTTEAHHPTAPNPASTARITGHNICDDITTTVEHLLAEEGRHLTEYVAAAERAEQQLLEQITKNMDEEAEQLARLVDDMEKQTAQLAQLADGWS